MTAAKFSLDRTHFSSNESAIGMGTLISASLWRAADAAGWAISRAINALEDRIADTRLERAIVAVFSPICGTVCALRDRIFGVPEYRTVGVTLPAIGGMAYSLADEGTIMRRLTTESVEQHSHSHYADVVCRTMAADEDFLWTQFRFHRRFDPSDRRCHNPTSLGNVAFISMHSPEPYKSRAKSMYNALLNHMKENKIV